MRRRRRSEVDEQKLHDAALRGPLWSMVKDEELVWRKRELSVRPALVIRELDFAGAVQKLHDGTDLTAKEAVRGHV